MLHYAAQQAGSGRRQRPDVCSMLLCLPVNLKAGTLNVEAVLRSAVSHDMQWLGAGRGTRAAAHTNCARRGAQNKPLLCAAKSAGRGAGAVLGEGGRALVDLTRGQAYLPDLCVTGAAHATVSRAGRNISSVHSRVLLAPLSIAVQERKSAVPELSAATRDAEEEGVDGVYVSRAQTARRRCWRARTSTSGCSCALSTTMAAPPPTSGLRCLRVLWCAAH